jgi:hypothetical protein
MALHITSNDVTALQVPRCFRTDQTAHLQNLNRSEGLAAGFNDRCVNNRFETNNGLSKQGSPVSWVGPTWREKRLTAASVCTGKINECPHVINVVSSGWPYWGSSQGLQ